MTRMSERSFPTFYFDGNRHFLLVDGPESWFKLLTSYPSAEDLEEVLQAKMAPATEVAGLPPGYFAGAAGVNDGDIPSFGFRREHLPGTIRLVDWAKARGVNLRDLAARRPRA